MKTIKFLSTLALVAALFLGCSSDEGGSDKEQKQEDDAVADMTFELHITFEEGPLKGKKHIFKGKDEETLYTLAISADDGKGIISSLGLRTDDYLKLHEFDRFFEGSIKKGTLKSRKIGKSAGCGTFEVIDSENKTPSYQRIKGNFIGCNDITIDKLYKWIPSKSNPKYKKRWVSGTFTDTLKMLITYDDGSKQIISSKVTVKFIARQGKVEN